MSILFGSRRQTGAQQRRLSLWQRLSSALVSHMRQAIGSLGELWRTPAASIMTIGVLGLSITLPSTLYILVKNTDQISAGWQQAAEISVFLKPQTNAQQREQLQQRLKLWPEVAEIEPISAEQALREFQQASGFGEALSYLPDNPLPHSLIVRPTSKHSSPTAAAALLNKLQQQQEVDQGRLDIQWLQRLHALLGVANNLITLIAILLFVAVVLIVGNTIRLNIVARKDEILVMKLVGATDAFIHRPFLYTGFWYGLLGGVLAWLAVQILLLWIQFSISDLATEYLSNFQVRGFGLTALVSMLLLAVVLGMAGSALSVQRYVKQIEPQ